MYTHQHIYTHIKISAPTGCRECFQRTEFVSETHKKGKTEEFSFQFCFDWNKINSAPLNFYTLGDFIQCAQGDFTPFAGGGGRKEAEVSRAQVCTKLHMTSLVQMIPCRKCIFIYSLKTI